MSKDDQTARDIETLHGWIDAARPGGVVFFGGAGVSTESGIPDFRSPSGLYSAQSAQRYDYPPEVMVSRSFFDAHPREFFDFYFDRMVFRDARPNVCHRKLAELEARGIVSAVITQNIDGLHQAAGSKRVLELHGSVHRNRCMECGRQYGLAVVLGTQGVPRCACGGVIKPEVVLYEEMLDEAVLQASVHAIAGADLLIVGGTSLNVYPAAGLLRYYAGRELVVVNKTPTPADKSATLVLTGAIGEIFAEAPAS